jgi:predicted Ser/Thr protein kinase
MQARVYLIHQGDQKIVVKDFGNCPCLIRYTFCRFVFKREIRAMQLLQSLHITPRYLGQVDQYAYAMEYIEGENFRFKKHATNPQFLNTLRETVNSMHALGVVHNDLHGKNMIISNDHKIYFIDFSSSLFRSANNNFYAKLKNKLFDFFALVDNAKIADIINRYDATLLASDDHYVLGIKKYTAFFTRVWKKLINGPLLRKRTWKKRKQRLQQWLGF